MNLKNAIIAFYVYILLLLSFNAFAQSEKKFFEPGKVWLDTDGSSDWKAGLGVKMYYPNNVFPSGIEVKNNANSTLSVYPNPANQILNFKNIEIGSRVLISNMIGAIVVDQLMSEPKLNIGSLPEGIYILKVTGLDEQSGTIKIIKY
jgi:hypothetical protein